MKTGWRARPPSGIRSDHTFIKRGVKGKLRKGKTNISYLTGLIPQPPLPLRRSGSMQIAKPPMEKLAAYAATQRCQLGPAATEQDARVDGASVTAAQKAAHVGAASVAAAQQDNRVGAARVASINQCDTGAAATEPGAGVDANGGGDTATIEEEMEIGAEPGLDAFDRGFFMKDLRAENRLVPSMWMTSILVQCRPSDEEDFAFNQREDAEEAYVAEVESDPKVEDIGQVFWQNVPGGSYTTKTIALKLDAAALNDGRGATKSAAASGESSIVLLKLLWTMAPSRYDAFSRSRSKHMNGKLQHKLKTPRNTWRHHWQIEETKINSTTRGISSNRSAGYSYAMWAYGWLVQTLCCNENGAVPRNIFGRYMNRKRKPKTIDKTFQIQPVLPGS
ncbi:hypothetical protein GN244_ATG12722 [Phytophthora infestans]|uniref:PiggyBac transposable element-derived protein domain-containing protein n=1 Tax=Phytophthora infestans TaxID=4787 RepID=A0A833WSD7_PHYIN|nr:hypothetical protein GN244_ATG12722 [Phytophthora infestans]